ncbi:hypothetical protein N7510_004373 [Penicillium lagena]|uniref:uncharacterized protein n=1 Tax=Penicillium lagena TaxID=94218 RepID=UPI002540E998|nr:uncharacterized protein N7510_004373 [Penicillium lagena]KAJ5620389.1 hypothetical protein N7510_004373 [Penicillium lagena]
MAVSVPKSLLGPISVTQFLEQFRSSWAASRWVELRRIREAQSINENGLNSTARNHAPASLPRKLGLAVSGGADSMALAYLCRQLEIHSASITDDAISVTAFVVDHRARAESSHEAKTVAGWLSDLGIKTQILELDWSQFTLGEQQALSSQKASGASIPSAFETYARTLRFQALGTACRDREIKTLLMGHHQDDNVETAVCRLASGARGIGLTGISPIAHIPECYGIFGVSESGSLMKAPARQDSASRVQVRVNDRNRGTFSFGPSAKTKPLHRLAKNMMPNPSISSGGILICRPLLSFPKAKLIATCHENNVPYVSDPTNFDPTLTARNTVRSLLASDSFPRALQPSSILSLIRSKQTLLQSSTELSNQLLASQCRILDFNFQTGAAVVSFGSAPRGLESPDGGISALTNLPASKLRQIQALTLRRITGLIAPVPENRYPLPSFEPFVSQVFPLADGGNQTSRSTNEKNQERRPFTLGGVIFQPLEQEVTSMTEASSAPSGIAPVHDFMGESVWYLSRQPIRRSQSRVPISRPDTPALELNLHLSKHRSVTPWTLWDDRFWFRFSMTPTEDHSTHKQNPDEKIAFVLRALQPGDLQKVRNVEPEILKPANPKNSKPAMRLAGLRKALAQETTGSARFTIPLLIVTRSHASGSELPEDEVEEQLLALPTIGYRLIGGGTKLASKINVYYAGREWRISWEWMYKMIDTETLSLMGLPMEENASATAMVQENKT